MNKVNIGFLLAGLVFLPGCIRVPSYSRKPLKSVSDNPTYRKVEQNIIVQAKRLTQDDTQYLFGTHCQQKDNSLEVIYLSIDNLSTRSYQLRSADIGCEILPYQRVAQDMKTNSAIRLAGGIAPIGATAYPSVYLFAFGIFLSSPIALSAGLSLATLGIGSGLIFLSFGIKSIVMNTRIQRDIKEKIVPKKVMIKPGDHYEGLIFMKSSDYTSQFSITMHEFHDMKNKIVFHVSL